MAAPLVELYGDLLCDLEVDRQAHSLAVGRKAHAAASQVPAAVRSELVTAAVLHDIGYAHPATDFHALDGARFLAEEGFSRRICHLVVHHSASTLEAQERGLDLALFEDFAVDDVVDLGPAHAVLWWADMTTGPRGEDVTVEHRLEEICARYGPNNLITRFVERARLVLLAAGQSPVGSIQVPS